MAFEQLKYSKAQIDRAGNALRKYMLSELNNEELDFNEALNIIFNWRAAHSYVVNTFNATLREKIKRIDPKALIAQRIKRFPSIVQKMQRRPTMRLSSMQDIGGLRAVMTSLKKIYLLEKDYENTKFKHQKLKPDDYIKNPKPSGYRCLHLLYRYESNIAPKYNGLNIEIQLRTKLMHAWATAIETVDTFLQYSLKASEGPQEWLDYFKQSSNALTFVEGTQCIPGFESQTKDEAFRSTLAMHKKLHVDNYLENYSLAVNHLTKEQNGSYYILILDPEIKELEYLSYGMDRLKEANEKYAELEKRYSATGSRQVVLVSASSLDSLKKAYPNYFLDTHEYLKAINGLKN